ncbi:MAG TPA: dihydropteroate synthase [Candidatus Dormibacteraeota bacterium]|nr:dihydropteroate synthase [Candidatus Dormibacteraeota bacterium]
MAIVNRTPDSFYDRGATYAVEAAVGAAERALDAGAGIIDIGGVKAGPGDEVSVAEEIERVIPAIAALRRRRPDVVISVDTWRAGVGLAAVEAGADLINDAWEGFDPQLAEVAAGTGAGLVCTHAGHHAPRTLPDRPRYADVVADIIRTTGDLAARAVALGARPDGIIVDAGLDFGKTTAQSLETIRRMDEIAAMGWPVLLAASNKDVVGETLDVPVVERLPGTLAITALSAWLGATLFRAHNVVETRQVLDMVASVRGDRAPAAARRGLD